MSSSATAANLWVTLSCCIMAIMSIVLPYDNRFDARWTCQTPLLLACSMRDLSAARRQPSTTELLQIVCTFVHSLRRGTMPLITCTPPGYSYIEKARPWTESALSTRTNHRGLCLIYASYLSAREVPLPACKSGMEVLTIFAVLDVMLWLL